MSTLSKQSIIPAATDLPQSVSHSSSQRRPLLDSATSSDRTQTTVMQLSGFEESSIAALRSKDISAAARQQKAIALLSQHSAIHSGELSKSAALITYTTAIALCADRVSLWLYGATNQFEQIASYCSDKQTLQSGDILSPEKYKPYLESLSDRNRYALDNVATSASAHHSENDTWVNCLIQQNAIYHAPGAFLDMPIRHRGEVVGTVWCEFEQPHHWNDLEQSSVLSISLLVAANIESQKQKTLSRLLDNHSKQLRRETIEREQAEQAWQESQRFIQGIIDASTNILYVDSFKDGSNFYISRWIKNVLGYETQEVQKLGPHYLEQLVHADQKQQLVTERKKLSAINDGEVVENEYQFRHRQGNWRWLLCRETVFQRDENGQPTQVFGTATDITKRKHAEDALMEFNKELTRLARMDGLTQVANRRAFDQYLLQEWNNVGSGRSSLSLILCDIDYFKSFNDTYGHQAGDVCLRQVAEAIERAVKRSSDMVARYGGEEFAVILPNTTEGGLVQVASEIQREIQELAIPHSCSEVSDYITLSLGLSAVSSTDNIHPDMLVAAADQGLYKAKYEGRDRYCISEIETEL